MNSENQTPGDQAIKFPTINMDKIRALQARRDQQQVALHKLGFYCRSTNSHTGDLTFDPDTLDDLIRELSLPAYGRADSQETQ